MSRVEFIAAPPRIYVVGITTPVESALDQYMEDIGQSWVQVGENPPGDPQAIIEAAGRVCYASWNNPAKRTRHQYICSSIIDNMHGSVLEHLWVNLMVKDLPRSTQLELVRHGDGTAFSFESTRFTDKNVRFIIPPLIRHSSELVEHFCRSCLLAKDAYDVIHSQSKELTSDDEVVLNRKRAKEASRAILPNALGSDGMVSLNARALRWIVQSRSDPHADLSIREFAYALYAATRDHLPAVFADATVTGMPDGIPRVSFSVPKV